MRRYSTRAGTAEIELLLLVVIFITLLMLVKGSMELGLARLQTAEDALLQVFRDATMASPPQYDADQSLRTVIGYGEIRPGLPLRSHVSRPERDVTIYGGDKEPLPPFTVGASAALPSPAWAYSGHPYVPADRQATQFWFEDYVPESHSELIEPLGLAAPWPP